MLCSEAQAVLTLKLQLRVLWDAVLATGSDLMAQCNGLSGKQCRFGSIIYPYCFCGNIGH